MKKLLIFIFSIFFGLIGFSSADCFTTLSLGDILFLTQSDSNWDYEICFDTDGYFILYNFLSDGSFAWGSVEYSDSSFVWYPSDEGSFMYLGFYSLSGLIDLLSPQGGGSSSDITVYYNNGLTTSIACNGDNIITINGLSTMSSISTFTPYFNINYTDQNNQVLTDSYSNSILYLSGGQYLKTYTGGSNNDWVLNLVSSEDTVFTGYLPTFDVTGNITDIDTGNVFNNFAENSLTVLLSNIPNYIQYVIMFALLLFVLGIFRRLRK